MGRTLWETMAGFSYMVWTGVMAMGKKGGGQIFKLIRAPSATGLSNVFSFVLVIRNLIPCVGHRGGEMRYGRSTGTRSGVSKLKLFPDFFYPFGTT